MFECVNIAHMNATTSKQQREAADGKYMQLFKNLMISALVAGMIGFFAPGYIGAIIGTILFAVLDQMDDDRRSTSAMQP